MHTTVALFFPKMYVLQESAYMFTAFADCAPQELDIYDVILSTLEAYREAYAQSTASHQHTAGATSSSVHTGPPHYSWRRVVV